MKNNKGFSLVELIVVIAIMAILAAVAIPTFATFITRANEASDKQFVADLTYAIELSNASLGKKEVSAPTITTDGNGVIQTVTYTLTDMNGTTTTSVTITVNDATDTATVTDPTGDANKEIIAAANDAISTMDWSYHFKSNAWADGDGTNS
ncbi:MAG: type II secretion system protein [Clostridia bacterium]|nr:type II secretion system protein [Clostridia bacterium]